MSLVPLVEPVPVADLGEVHFVGIGGAGMSGIARILLQRGVTVSGSDSNESALLDELRGMGAAVHVGHAAGHIGSADTVVVSTAVRQSNPELVEARRRGLRVIPRATALASLMLGRRGVAVAGTHGKTTTTSMLTVALQHCGADPAYVIGGRLLSTGLGAADGGGDLFIAETDESDGSFRVFAPHGAIVTNVEADHLDNYGSLAEVEASFAAFVRRIEPGGFLISCADHPGAREVAEVARAGGVRVRTYGEASGADYHMTEVRALGMRTTFAVTVAGGKADAGHGETGNPIRGDTTASVGGTGDATWRLEIQVPGRHNALNAAAAFATACELGVPAGEVAAGLGVFRGAERRMELKGDGDGVRVFDSYAHHPTEVAADLRAARDIADGGRIIAIFQPHLYSRTRIFAVELGTALGLADEAVVLDIYASREDPEPGVTGQLVADAVPGGRAHYLADTGAVPGLVAEIAKPGDVVLTMGAGDVTVQGPLLVESLRTRAGAGW